MGTSSSSGGPKRNVPLIPDWVPPLPPLPPADQPPDQIDPDVSPDLPPDVAVPTPIPPIPPTQIAVPRRFQSARINLGKFAQSGSADYLRKGLGHYTRTGLGGGRAATQRMGRTASTAGTLHGVLTDLGSGVQPAADLGIDPTALAGRAARDVADVIANALVPADGTQDAEAGRDAIARAFSDLLDGDPQADLLALSADQIDGIVESYIAYDLCHRIELDIGLALLDKAPSPAIGMQRLEELREYVQQEVARCFRARAGSRLTRQNAASLTAAVLRDTFAVFEDYIQ